MGRLRLSCLCLLAGCNQVLGLEPVEPPPRDAAAIDGRVAAGHDEDLDTIDDAFDVCPNVADDQLDADGDGVGDACDPNPKVPIDRLRAFFDLRDFAGWTPVTGTWEPGTDEVTQRDPAGNQLATLDLGAVSDPTLIAVVTAAAAGASQYGVGLYLITGAGLEPGLPAGLACYVALPGGRLVSWDNRTPGAATSVAAADTISGYPVRVTLRASSPDPGPGSGPSSCSVLDPANGSGAVVQTTAPIPSATVGLYTYMGSATFGSVVVIDRVP
ncbi:MAG: hypothetical protein IPL61_34820 [Myxococcales bacterium]|nr:hypothetical protein [Myxococcales bacterium]